MIPVYGDLTKAPREFNAACEDLARAVVGTAGLYAPGLTEEDMIQEARVAVWQAIGDYDRSTDVPFAAFAILCARRRLVSAVIAAKRLKHRPFNEASRLEAPIAQGDGADMFLADVLADDHQDPCRTVLAREAIREVAARMAGLTEWEQECLRRVVINGEDYAAVGPQKRVDNGVQRARAKLAQGARPTRQTARSVFVDRTVYPEPSAAVAAALDVLPGRALAASKRKLLDGKERAPQGRPDRSGRLGQPVWRIDIVPEAA